MSHGIANRQLYQLFFPYLDRKIKGNYSYKSYLIVELNASNQMILFHNFNCKTSFGRKFVVSYSTKSSYR